MQGGRIWLQILLMNIQELLFKVPQLINTLHVQTMIN